MMNIFVGTLIEQALRNKDNIAIASDKYKLTYEQLINIVEERALQLIDYGVQRGSIVAVVSDDSADTVINNIAVAFAGGIFLPIDEQIPYERFKHICNDSKLEYIIVNSNFKISNEIKISNIINFSQKNIADNRLQDIWKIRNYEDDSMYILYTSGSSGLSKGVIIQNKSFMIFRDAINDVIEFDKRNIRFLASTSLTFDISILETLITLTYGATCIITNKKQRLMPKEIRNIIINEKINAVQFTPTYVQLLSDYFKGDLSFFHSIEKILIGGEIFREELLIPLKYASNADIYNCYGPTETTIWASIKKIVDGENITLGQPLKNYKLYIESEEDNEGEICIAGDAVAKGYLNRPELTNSKFFTDLYGKRVYKTGDLGRINKEGELVFLGRIDRQVKIKGFRVELDEIEKTIERCFSTISRAVVILIKNYNKESLVCYYQSTELIKKPLFIKRLLDYLPTHMVPILYVKKDQLPVMINGKIDYTTLSQELKNINEQIEY